MSGFLLDTNCISELVRPRPEPRVIGWIDRTGEDLLYLSVLTLGEIRKGVAGLSPGRRRARIEAWLTVELPGRFSGRILGIDANVADQWGLLAGQAKSKGVSLPIIDGLLAATALVHDLIVVSRNSKDFEKTKAPVLNPWTA